MPKTETIIITLICLLFFPTIALADGYEGTYDLFDMHHMMSGFGFWQLGGFIMFILWIFLIAIILIFFLNWTKKEDPGKNQKEPLDILKERFARGEIDRKEYEEKKKILTK